MGQLSELKARRATACEADRVIRLFKSYGMFKDCDYLLMSKCHDELISLLLKMKMEEELKLMIGDLKESIRENEK